ncbi:MAG: GNAT family N-acetyltransferase [Pseudolabrys sp.]
MPGDLITGEILTAVHETRSEAAVFDMVCDLTMEPVACAAWDATLSLFDDVCPEQTYAFGRMRWPFLQHEPWLFRSNGRIVGGALIMLQQLPLRLGTVAIGKWAPMLRDAAAANAPFLYRGMIEALIANYAERRGMMLVMLPRARCPGRFDEAAYLRRRGFAAGSNVAFPNRYIVDLRDADDVHRKRLGSKWRYHLGKSEKNGLTFEVGDASTLPTFARLYEAMSERKKFPDYSAYDTVPDLLSMDAVEMRPQLFFVRHGGEVVSGAIIFKAGNTAMYLYGATNEQALPLRAGYFMHWQIVRWLKANTSAQWYDLGGSDGFLGLHQFKKGMIGDAGAIVPLPPMMHYAARKFPLMAGRMAFAARDALLDVRQWLLTRWSDRAKPDLVNERT